MRLVLVLGDQLSPDIAALRTADRDRDVVVMAEVMEEATYVRHHPKKIAFLFAAMRKHADALRRDGWRVLYTRLDDPGNAGSIVGELIRRAGETGASEVVATEPGEWRLIGALGDAPIPVRQLPDDRFLASRADFARWAEGRRELRMEWFYREMRRATGLMMQDGKPAGGRWNFDSENRKPPPKGFAAPGPFRAEPDAVTEEVLDLVEDRFAGNFGQARPFWFATDRTGALAALARFVDESLPAFGDYQDAMLADDRFLHHAVVGLYLNAGLLSPMEVARAAEAAWQSGRVPINAAEGFVRQVIGWREYLRGIYFLEGPEYPSRNVLGHDRALPDFFWSGETDMACIAAVVRQTAEEAYAHHIQRLMVTGNFALLAGLDPQAVHDWYMCAYVDAYEWVMSPNVIGMSQFADGGVVASKPYVSSGAYIDRMSDYCRGCAYGVKTKTGDGACPFNLLYWHFLDRHRGRFEGNRRMGPVYRNWDRMAGDRRETIVREAGAWLARLDAGERV